MAAECGYAAVAGLVVVAAVADLRGAEERGS